MLRSHVNWLCVIFVKPAGLSLDVARGHRLTFDDEESFISYLDIAARIFEAADDEEGRYDGRNVGVVNETRGVSAKFPRGTPLCVSIGLAHRFSPWLHPYLPWTGPA